MSTLKHLDSGQRRFQDAKGMFITPYDEDGLLGDTTYDIHDIVGDTLSITQDDAEKTEIPWEFGDDNLDENVKLGNKNFTCQCLDFQDDVMKALFGCEVVKGALVFPKEYKDLYVMIRVVFDNVDFVLPYVKMDAKATMENMRTDIARGDLSGTIMSHKVVIAEMPTAGGQAPSTSVTAVTTGENKNVAETPMLYVPNGSTNGKAVYVAGQGTEGSTVVYQTDIHEDVA